jgi:hypothetical protein
MQEADHLPLPESVFDAFQKLVKRNSCLLLLLRI